jgi:hypothetical protein
MQCSCHGVWSLCLVMMTIFSKKFATISSEVLELLWHPHRAFVDYLSHMIGFPVGTTDRKWIFLGVATRAKLTVQKHIVLY